MAKLNKYRVDSIEEHEEMCKNLYLAGIPYKESMMGRFIYTAVDDDGNNEEVIRCNFDNKCYPISNCVQVEGFWYAKMNARRIFSLCSVCGQYHSQVYNVDDMEDVCGKCLEE